MFIQHIDRCERIPAHKFSLDFGHRMYPKHQPYTSLVIVSIGLVAGFCLPHITEKGLGAAIGWVGSTLLATLLISREEIVDKRKTYGKIALFFVSLGFVFFVAFFLRAPSKIEEIDAFLLIFGIVFLAMGLSCTVFFSRAVQIEKRESK